jgi:hypothetical protein
MAGNTKTQQAIVLLSIGLIAAGAWVAFREASPYLRGGIGDTERFAAIERAAPDPGPSIASQRLVLDNCVRTMTSLYARLQPSERRQVAIGNCLRTADGIATENPASSYAWYAGALASERLGDVSGMAARLVMSQKTGPTEQWIAELRVPLAEEHLATLGPQALANHERDLRMLVGSSRGINSIARRYVDVASFRERITAIVETMPETEQRRFVSRVETASQSDGT